MLTRRFAVRRLVTPLDCLASKISNDGCACRERLSPTFRHCCSNAPAVRPVCFRACLTIAIWLLIDYCREWRELIWLGRIEARTGLRMMPTFPRSPLSFRTAGFPRYGWKGGISDGAFL